MITRLDELLLESVRPQGFTADLYVNDLKRPIGAIEKTTGLAAHEELLRIVRSWPDQDSPLSRCRLACIFKHFKHSLPLPDGSLGDLMLKIVEKSIPPKVEYVARLHEIGFTCFLFAYDLSDITLKAFWREKGVELDMEYKQEMFQAYLLAVYHLGRSRMLPMDQRELILFGVHDSYNSFFCRGQGLEEVAPQSFVTSYQAVIERWIKSASDARPQSPSYALVRTVFNMLGLTSPIDRMSCATLLDASANHMLELSEVIQHNRASAGM
jgi:hypothetical protein